MYKYLPTLIQDIAVTFKGYCVYNKRYNRLFKKFYKGYLERQSYSKDEIINYRFEKRKMALFRASKTLFYRNFFSQTGASWRDFVDDANFSKLPIVRKEDLSENIDKFRCRPVAKSDDILRTSGTTGTSLEIPISSNVEPDQWAVWWRYRNWHGLTRNTLCGLFSSTPIVFDENSKRPYRLNLIGNEIRFSIFHISEDNAKYYVDCLNRYKPIWIHGNPTAISLLSFYINKLRLVINYDLKIITIGSENLLPWQKKEIENAFNLSPIQHYGLSEGVANFSECVNGNIHVDEDYSYVEFIPESDCDSFKIVGTCFSNEAISLLRYDTGDLACITDDTCSCGNHGRIVKSLDGRLTDYITLPNGQKVASLAAPFHSTPGLAGAQLYQANDGSLTVRYVPGFQWKNEYLIDLEYRLRLRVGKNIQLNFHRVQNIEKTERGKTKLVISDYNQH